MNWKRYTLLFLSLLGFLTFFYFRDSLVLNCSGTPLECREFGKYSPYIWRVQDFSVALLVIGLLVLIKPVALRSIYILTAITIIGTAIAVYSAPEISSDFLVPLDKKNVGMLLAWAYGIIAGITWLWAFLKQKKTSNQEK